MYKPSPAEFFTVGKTPDGLGGNKQTKVSRGTINGWLDMLTGDDDQQVQKAHIEMSTHVLVVRPKDNGRTIPFVPKKGELMVFNGGKTFVVTYVDDPVGIGHHLEIFLDNSINGVT